MAIEHYILKSFVKDKEVYQKLYPKISDIDIDGPIKFILDLIDKYYTEFEEHNYISKDQLISYLDILYPCLKDRDIYTNIIYNIYNIDVSDSITKLKIKQLKVKDYANQIAQTCIPAISGEDFNILDDIETLLAEAKSSLDEESDNQEDEEVYCEASELEDLITDSKGDGLRWRLECLNDDVGPLKGGSLGHIFARPESGKTSWVHSEMSRFCKQFKDRGNDEIGLWFNNEEKLKKIKLRWWSAVTGLTREQILVQPEYAKQLYEQNGGDRLRIVDAAVLSVEQIEATMRKYKPRIVVIDIADKVEFKGSGKSQNGADRLKQIYDKLREVSKRCNKIWKVDIITTAQADAQAENQKWLYLSNLDSGKTGKAGAFDYVIGLGRLHSEEGVRYLYCCKNKEGDQSEKHVINFYPKIARFE